MKVVHIKWRDAAHIDGWRSQKAMKDFIRANLDGVDTVGMLVHEDRRKIVIVQTHGVNEVMGVFEIPKGCIDSIKVIGKI